MNAGANDTNANASVAASIAYFAPLAATWALRDASWAAAVSLAIPLCIGVAGYFTEKTSVLRHGFQSFHILATIFLISVAAGLLAHPGNTLWFGALGSIPLGAASTGEGAALWARAAFWSVASARMFILLFLGVAAARGRNIYIPALAEPPAKLSSG